MKEEFATHPYFPDYLISNCGRIKTKSRNVRYVHAVTGNEHFRTTTERYLKQYDNVHGYKFVQLRNIDGKVMNKTVHRLVAETFLRTTGANQTVVNHKDGNKLNNTYANLEWCTDEYNHEHATKNGLKAKGVSVGSSKLNDNAVHAIKVLLQMGYSHGDIAKMFLVSRPTISLISEGKTWKQIALTGEELEIEL